MPQASPLDCHSGVFKGLLHKAKGMLGQAGCWGRPVGYFSEAVKHLLCCEGFEGVGVGGTPPPFLFFSQCLLGPGWALGSGVSADWRQRFRCPRACLGSVANTQIWLELAVLGAGRGNLALPLRLPACLRPEAALEGPIHPPMYALSRGPCFSVTKQSRTDHPQNRNLEVACRGPWCPCSVMDKQLFPFAAYWVCPQSYCLRAADRLPWFQASQPH